VALWKFQEVARHANGIYSSQFEVGVTTYFKMWHINKKRKLIIITSATALHFLQIIMETKTENDFYWKKESSRSREKYSDLKLLKELLLHYRNRYKY
jgi:hypothetical protein